MSNRVFLLVTAFLSIFVLIGGGTMFFQGKKIVRGCQAAAWPHTTATVLSVESTETSDPESSRREILVRYEYIVDGERYEGDTIHPAYGLSSSEEAHRRLEAILKPSGQVRVYYKSDEPAISTLSTGFYSGPLTEVFAGFLFLSMGLGFWLTIYFAVRGNEDVSRGITLVSKKAES